MCHSRAFPRLLRPGVAVMVLVACRVAEPCSVFRVGTGAGLCGRNYDWHVGDGYMMVNRRGMKKTAIADENPVSWTSAYGSVTFNQFGQEMPMGGMNEEGLVIETMWLDETEYAPPDSRRAIGNLQWIQYQLDTRMSVAEVIATDEVVRIAPCADARIHYMVCDRAGVCASIEFIDGVMVVHTGEQMPYAVLTNSTYVESVDYLHKVKGYGGILPMPNDNSSLGRFVRLADQTSKFTPQAGEKNVWQAFDMLAGVASGEYTKWSIVYDIGQRKIHFRTFEKQEVRTVDLGAVDYSCRKPVRAADINDPSLEGDITGRMIVFTPRRNRTLVERVFRQVDFLAGLPDEVREKNYTYPETLKCTE